MVQYTINKIDQHPEDKSSFLSHFFFCWQPPIVWQIRKNKIGDNDFVTACKNHDSALLGDKLEKKWSEEKVRKNPSLSRAILKVFGLELVLCGALYFPVDVASVVMQPVYLGKFLKYFSSNQTSVTKEDHYFNALMLILSVFLKVLSFQFFLIKCVSTGIKMRTSCSSLMYRKILRAKRTTLQKATLGQIINLFSNEVDRFDRVLAYAQILWIGVIKTIVTGVILYLWCGWQATVGMGLFYAFLCFQCYVVKVLAIRSKKVSQARDNRIRIISDVISGIQTIKMYAWEKSFAKIVNLIRRKEIEHIKSTNNLHGANLMLSFYVHKFPIYLYILLAVLDVTALEPEVVYMSTVAMDLAKLTLRFVGAGINQISELQVTIDRIQTFLLQCEDKTESKKRSKNPQIVVKNLSATWDTSTVLNNIDFEVSSGRLVAILGAAGSGKSSLLQTILQELTIVGGTLDVRGSLSYASQEPWIIPATLRENVVFGENYDEEKYRMVLRVCALEHDVSHFPFGDNTLVGERGAMLSGGQKARVNLARAVYRDADIYLLDDPLSAVDGLVAKQIFTECFLGYLKNKSIVLATHESKFLRNMNQIYVLDNGFVKFCGNHENLERVIGKSLFYNEQRVVIDDDKLLKNNKQSEIKEDDCSVTMNIYKCYLMSSGHWCFFFIPLTLCILSQLFINASDFFLTMWINFKENEWNFFTDFECLYIYSGIFILLIVVSHLCTSTFTSCCRKSSTNLHRHLLDSTLQAPMKFFNQHPSGRVLNRFSRDIAIIDEVIPTHLFHLIQQSLTMIGVCLTLIILNYWMIFTTLVLFIFFYVIVSFFTPALNLVKKTAATRRSPIFTQVSTTVQGITTIKTLQAQAKFLTAFDVAQNSFNAVEYLQRAFHLGFAFWVDVFSALYMTLFVFITLNIKEASVGNVGLALTQSFLLTWTAQYAVKLYGELDSIMTSVERVVKYADLEVEDDKPTLEVQSPWPSEGEIIFDSVSLRYSNDKPSVLQQINLRIRAGEKIGIIGRTGAGKSSLVSSLFRLYDFEGTILIDGVNTKLISLKTLRSNIAVIPQDPVFFLGTLRKNLDPFDEFEDHKLWSVLEDVKLKKMVENLSSGLETPIREGGTNFSVGQRQMLCLVRAALKNAKIVVLDEATANVDLKNDELIQATIRKRFRMSTVLTIAHRLDTVMDSDKILVMDEGNVVEFGSKEELLQDSSSYFYNYVNAR